MVFEPILAPFECCTTVLSFCQSETEWNAFPDIPCCHISSIIKWSIMFGMGVLYIFSFIWIVSVHQGVHACNMGARIMTAGTDPTGLTFSSASACVPSTCKFSAGLWDMDIMTYIDLRLTIFLASAAPCVYFFVALCTHTQHAEDELIQSLQKSAAEGGDTLTVLYNARYAFNPANWHMLWLALLVAMDLLIGIMAMSMDFGMASSLGSQWGITDPCRVVEDHMLKYQAEIRLSIKDLPIPLSIFCTIYVIWDILFLVQEIKKYVVNSTLRAQPSGN